MKPQFWPVHWWRGSRRFWVAERHRHRLPEGLESQVMEWRSDDRYHAKQGRSTARFRFDGPDGTLSVYLKRFERFPWRDRWLAAILPWAIRTPATVERDHLERARSLGIPVPEVVAVGESIGPRTRLTGFLMVEELSGSEALNEILPRLQSTLDARAFSRLKRSIIEEMAALAARLHAAGMFHRDFYLCHLFLDARPEAQPGRRLTLIDLHRLARRRVIRWPARWKDLGQLLYSTYEVPGIDDRDRLRFWAKYRRAAGLVLPKWQSRAIRAKAARYLAHNR